MANRAAGHSACANGYDGSLMTSIIAMPSFRNTFGTDTTGPTVAVIFSLYPVCVSSGNCLPHAEGCGKLTQSLKRCHGGRSVRCRAL